MVKPAFASPAVPNTEHYEARGRSGMREVGTLIAQVTDRHVASRRGTGVAAARVPVPS